MSGIFNNLRISSNVLSYCFTTRMFVQKKNQTWTCVFQNWMCSCFCLFNLVFLKHFLFNFTNYWILLDKNGARLRWEGKVRVLKWNVKLGWEKVFLVAGWGGMKICTTKYNHVNVGYQLNRYCIFEQNIQQQLWLLWVRSWRLRPENQTG